MPSAPVIARASLVAACLLLAAAGCVRVQRLEPGVGGATGAGTPGPEVGGDIDAVWPARWGEGASGRKGVIVPEEEPLDGLYGIFLGEHHRFRPGPREYRDADALARGLGVTGAFRFRPEEGGGMVFVPRREGWPPDPRLDGPEPSMVFRFVSGRAEPEAAAPGLGLLARDAEDRSLRALVGGGTGALAGGGRDRVVLQRTWFALYEPQGEARGLVVILPGLFGMPGWFIEPLTRELTGRGYAVLRMLALPSRFLAGAEILEDPVGSLAVPEGFGRIVTERLAEVAYAAEAAREHVAAERPGLRGLPAALVGMSGGALSLPAVWARDPGAYDAAVLIAGGADLATLGSTSAFADALLKVGLRRAPEGSRDGGGATPEAEAVEQAETFAALLGGAGPEYLAASPLDPFNLAPRMAGTPLLVVHGARDRVVPAATGDRLWERLGRPERWVYPLGHGALFLALPLRKGALVRWIDERLAEAGGAGVPATASSDPAPGAGPADH